MQVGGQLSGTGFLLLHYWSWVFLVASAAPLYHKLPADSPVSASHFAIEVLGYRWEPPLLAFYMWSGEKLRLSGSALNTEAISPSQLGTFKTFIFFSLCLKIFLIILKFFKDLSIYIHIHIHECFCIHVYLCTTYMPSAFWDQKRGSDSLELDLDSSELLSGSWKVNPGISQEHLGLLTTESALQPLSLDSYSKPLC